MDAQPAWLRVQWTLKQIPTPTERGLDAAGPVYSWWDRKWGRQDTRMALAYIVFGEGG